MSCSAQLKTFPMYKSLKTTTNFCSIVYHAGLADWLQQKWLHSNFQNVILTLLHRKFNLFWQNSSEWKNIVGVTLPFAFGLHCKVNSKVVFCTVSCFASFLWCYTAAQELHIIIPHFCLLCTLMPENCTPKNM